MPELVGMVRRVESLRRRHVSPTGQSESARQACTERSRSGQALFQALLRQAFEG
jgi:hypothetical protein